MWQKIKCWFFDEYGDLSPRVAFTIYYLLLLIPLFVLVLGGIE